MPGGFHPWHAGHSALYQSAQEVFPSAEVVVAATADTATRPFPFKLKKMLAQAAGVPAHRFIQVKSPFKAEEITQAYDAADTVLIFVRSAKDMTTQPQPGGVKKDGSASYLQPYKRNGLEPMTTHAYIAYLPVAQFGPGMTSATEIRAKWPNMDAKAKLNLVKSMYPAAQNDQAAGKLVEILDSILGASVKEDLAQRVVSRDQQNLLVNLSRELSQFVGMLKSGDYMAAQQLLNGEIAAQMYDLTHTDQSLGKPYENSNSSAVSTAHGKTDYVEEKSISM